METAVRKIHFCYGHRVMNHESKCATLHGHNAVVWIHAKPNVALDQLGRVVDFSVLKDKIGSWIDLNWDHTMIIYKEDKKTLDLIQQVEGPKKPFILETNPTAENMAHYLLHVVCPRELKNYDITVHKVTFYETENCYVEATLDQR